jgi:hypothetical protein
MTSFFIFQTFLLQSIDPVIPLAPPNEKYLANTTIWAALSTTFAANSLIENWRGPMRTDLLRVLTLGVALAIAVTSLSFVQYRDLPTPGALFWHARESYAPLAHAIKKGLPVLTAPGQKAPGKRMLGYLEALFSTDLVRIDVDDKDAKFFAYTTPEAAADPNRKVEFCVDLRWGGNQKNGQWLAVCPPGLTAKAGAETPNP